MSIRSRVIKQAKKTAKLRSRLIFHRKRRRKAARLARAYGRNKATLARLRRELAASRRKPPLRLRALQEAEKLIGVMEKGGNNRGPEVERIIREGGGRVGDAWCGWFVATCYRRAGSKRVTWQWGAVRLLRGLVGIRATSNPRAGDLVRFTFDHVGIFVRNAHNGHIETIEGNTGVSGAVSDSKTGGDGVYRKLRPKSLVRDYLHVAG
jgi:hypothetical protein